ncbi:MAG: DUF3606 domain-containing protein [Pedobacter sp.]|nr:DUF3606 domain-containing protein [Pedobacter sp.]MDQ8051718.1 DUF3606 domain-containing protein [Pedobacter sp.]
MINQYSWISPDTELIDISDEKERSIWASRLGVSIEKLKTAVRATHSLDVEKLSIYLHHRPDQKTYNYKTHVKN